MRRAPLVDMIVHVQAQALSLRIVCSLVARVLFPARWLYHALLRAGFLPKCQLCLCRRLS